LFLPLSLSLARAREGASPLPLQVAPFARLTPSVRRSRARSQKEHSHFCRPHDDDDDDDDDDGDGGDDEGDCYYNGRAATVETASSPKSLFHEGTHAAHEAGCEDRADCERAPSGGSLPLENWRGLRRRGGEKLSSAAACQNGDMEGRQMGRNRAPISLNFACDCSHSARRRGRGRTASRSASSFGEGFTSRNKWGKGAEPRRERAQVIFVHSAR